MIYIGLILVFLLLGVVGLYIDTQVRLRRKIEQLQTPIKYVYDNPSEVGPPDRYVVGWDDSLMDHTTLPQAWAQEQAIKGTRVPKEEVQLQTKLWKDFEAD